MNHSASNLQEYASFARRRGREKGTQTDLKETGDDIRPLEFDVESQPLHYGFYYIPGAGTLTVDCTCMDADPSISQIDHESHNVFALHNILSTVALARVPL